MKLPLHTTSSPARGAVAQKLLRAAKSQRPIANAKAREFARTIVVSEKHFDQFKAALSAPRKSRPGLKKLLVLHTVNRRQARLHLSSKRD